MARIAVLEFGQSPETSPCHFVSKQTAQAFLNHVHNRQKAVTKLHDRLLAIQVDLTFGKLKALLRPPKGPVVIPRILPPRRPDWMFTAYPIKDERTLIL